MFQAWRDERKLAREIRNPSRRALGALPDRLAPRAVHGRSARAWFRNADVVSRVIAGDLWCVFPVNGLSEARVKAAVRQSVNKQSLLEIAVRRYTWRVLRVRREVVIGAQGQFERLGNPSRAGGIRLTAPERRMTCSLRVGSSKNEHAAQVPIDRKGQTVFAMHSTRNLAEIVACPAQRSG